MHVTPTNLTPSNPTVVPAAVAHPRARAQVSPQDVSAAIRSQADGDGDGKTGAAALNDGDAAANAAAQQVKNGLNVKA